MIAGNCLYLQCLNTGQYRLSTPRRLGRSHPLAVGVLSLRSRITPGYTSNFHVPFPDPTVTADPGFCFRHCICINSLHSSLPANYLRSRTRPQWYSPSIRGNWSSSCLRAHSVSIMLPHRNDDDRATVAFWLNFAFLFPTP